MKLPSVLTTDDIQILLAEHYGIDDVLTINAVKIGNISHCFRVDTVGGISYFLKESSLLFTPENLRAEAEILQLLGNTTIPVAPFIFTNQDEHAILFKGTLLHLHLFIEGNVFTKHTAPKWLQRSSAEMLGRLQAILSGYRMSQTKLGMGWFAQRQDPGHGLAKYEQLIKQITALPDDSLREEILSEIRYRMGQLKKASALPINPNQFTFGTTHGDYNVEQILVQGREIVGVTDFERAAYMPLVWEVLRSYSMADPSCESGMMHIGNLKCYISWYFDQHHLTRSDLKNAPYLMYFYIVNNVHGYKEFLDAQAINSGSMLDYGRWHTRILHWLEEHMDETSRELVKLSD